MKSAIWIIFDLGVRGDYEGIYTWLDQHGAKECGNSAAFLNYEYSGELLSALKADLEESIQVSKKTRIYVAYSDLETKKVKGQFIIGGRKASPWEGYAVRVSQVDADES
ncbi:hypothetical protein [Methylomagnum sp.]